MSALPPDLSAGITVNSNQTILPCTNGAAKVEEVSAIMRTENDASDLAPECEKSPNAAPTSRKRASIEPCKQPEPKRMRRSPSPSLSNNTEPTMQASSDYTERTDRITKETWQGFCEIESEPAFFSAILQDMGVQDINVREVVAMHPDFLGDLPRPIHGLILLYRYREHGSSDQTLGEGSHVWFANQLPAQNSCATLAMINILMNNTDIKIGEHLQQFKDFTKDMAPYQRGEALASFDFVKKIHNSFAKEMDILEADKHLSYKVRKAQRQSNSKKSRRKSTDSAATDDSAEGYEDTAHHFIAYIPVGNDVWMLDGLNAQPLNVATFKPEQGEDWVSVAADSILAILASGGDDYTGFAIMPSALPSLRKEACLALNHIESTESRLDDISPDWRSFLVDDEPARVHPQVLSIEDQLPAHPVSGALAAVIASEGTHDLLARRARVLKDLEHIASNIVSEMQSEADNAQMAAQGRFDHGPVIRLWAEMLASNGYLEQNLDRFIRPKAGSRKATK
ncbi:Ubiquitin carboxyl-terminal hydrolase 2-like protein 1 [Stagonosporopsis vannaccii]|nr:Ubiquitin carboxyl-terminal hydrolase 2-like protein 1 [Stagonosporopsis vannaccii]